MNPLFRILVCTTSWELIHNIDDRMLLLFFNYFAHIIFIGVHLLCCYHACYTSNRVLYHQSPFNLPPKASGSDHTDRHSCWWVLKIFASRNYLHSLAAVLCFNISCYNDSCSIAECQRVCMLQMIWDDLHNVASSSIKNRYKFNHFLSLYKDLCAKSGEEYW